MIHPKVQGAGIGGAVATLLVLVLDLAGVKVSADLAAAIATIVSFAAGFLTPAR